MVMCTILHKYEAKNVTTRQNESIRESNRKANIHLDDDHLAKQDSIYYGPFCIYLLVIALCFLVYIHIYCRLMQRNLSSIHSRM